MTMTLGTLQVNIDADTRPLKRAQEVTEKYIREIVKSYLDAEKAAADQAKATKKASEDQAKAWKESAAATRRSVSKSEDSLDELENAFRDVGKAGKKAAKDNSRATRQIEGDIRDMSAGIASSMKKAAAAYAVIKTAEKALQALMIADEIRIMEVALARMVGGAAEAEKAILSLTKSANAVGVSIADAGKVFNRFALLKDDLDLSNEQLSQMTDTLLKLGALGGSTADEIRMSMVQLAQGLSGPIIRAQDFRSVLASTPEVIRFVAREMGLTMAEIQQKMLDGELQSADFKNALLDMFETVNGEAAKLPTGIEQATNAIKNNMAIILSNIASSMGIVAVLQEVADLQQKLIDMQGESAASAREEERKEKIYAEMNQELRDRVDLIKENQTAIAKLDGDMSQGGQMALAALKEYNQELKTSNDLVADFFGVKPEAPEKEEEKEKFDALDSGDLSLIEKINRLGETEREAINANAKKLKDKVDEIYVEQIDQRQQYYDKIDADTQRQLAAVADREQAAIDAAAKAAASAAAQKVAAAEAEQEAANKKIETIRQIGETEREEIRRIAEEKHEFLMTQTQLDAEELAELQQKINDDAMAALGASADREQDKKKQQAEKEKADLEQLEEDKRRIREQGLARAGQLTGQLNDLMVAAGKEGSDIAKAIFLANKAIQVAQIITATHVAAANAAAVAAAGGPVPFFATEAAILAQGYASAGIVAGTAVANTFGGGRQFGGSVSPMMAHPVNEAGVPELLEMGSKQYLLPTGAGGTISPLSDSSTGSPNVTIISNGTPQTVDNVSMTRGEIAVMISDMGRRTERRINSSLASGRGDTARSLQTGFKADRNLR